MISKSVFIKKKRIMEQFSLEKYLANPSRKVVTRDGRNARIICTDMNYKNHPIVALIAHDNDTENVYTYTKDGEWDNYESTTYDLFFAPEKDKEQRFNPKTLKPFDKVLTRCDDSEKWGIDLFGYFDNLYKGVCCLDAYLQMCIPYNDETKHLVGTTNDCPYYYQWWEE